MSNDPTTLVEALLASASHHAALAVRDRKSPDFHLRLGAAVSTGAAVELLSKHLLALKQPLYLQELKPKDVKTAWRTRELLSGSSIPYNSTLGDVKSVSAFEAIEMTRSLYPELKLIEAPLRSALQARNAAIHLGIIPSHNLMEDAIYGLVLLFQTAHDLELIENLPFKEQSEEVSRFLYYYRERRTEHVDYKIVEANERRFNLTVEGRRDLGEDVSFFLDTWYRQIVGEEPESIFRGSADFETHKCLVCKEDAIVVVELSGDADVDEVDGETTYVLRTIKDVIAFGCRTCGLELSLVELQVLAQAGNKWADYLFKSGGIT